LRRDRECRRIGFRSGVGAVDISRAGFASNQVRLRVARLVFPRRERAVRPICEPKVCGEFVVAHGDIEGLQVHAVKRGAAAESGGLARVDRARLFEVDVLDGREDAGVHVLQVGADGGWVEPGCAAGLAGFAGVVIGSGLEGGFEGCSGSECRECEGEEFERHLFWQRLFSISGYRCVVKLIIMYTCTKTNMYP
jgi:hypothetical protein